MNQRRVLTLAVGLTLLGASLGSALAASPTGSTRPAVQDVPVTAEAFDGPGEIRRGEPYEVAVELVNSGETTVTVDVAYVFEDERIDRREVALDPNARQVVAFQIPAELVEELVASFGTGTHTHGIAIDGEVRHRFEVTIVASDTTAGDDDAAEQAKATLEEASVTLERAGAGLDRAQEAIDAAAADGADVDDLESDLRELEAEFERAREEYAEASAEIENGNHESAIELASTAADRASRVGERAAELEATARDRAEAGTTESVDEDTATESGGGDVTSTPGRETPSVQRGFFTNRGESPVPFLENPTNPTTLGIVLSIAGILFQLVQGRK